MTNACSYPCAEEMRPKQILAAREACSCAFVPVSPMFEWHALQLPLGTDALITEAICREVAAEVKGIWFRPLSFGLDVWRNETELRMWGFAPTDKVFGMRFPELPICSEYSEPGEMRAAVLNRVHALRETGFRHIFLVNTHGGKGQQSLLAALATEHTQDKCRLHAVATHQFNTLGRAFPGVGGHAGLSETTWVLAFRPELVDLTEQQEGALEVPRTGILHSEPVIPAEFNPRRSSMEAAHALRHSVVDNFVRFVREKLKGE
jgi:creatinine amidohydrolase/Fe(II)-dependent formamide hydrolase-like protein